jgi:hypothetical protein
LNKPASSKLFKLKAWLTLPDAAKHLAIVYGEDVTEADILRWALDGHLKLSVYFKDTIYGAPGYLKEDTQLHELSFDKGPLPEEVLKLIELIGESFSKYIFVEKEKERVVPINGGVFDLPMIGAEWNYIERKWQKLTSGPKENHKSLEEVIVEECTGNVYALKEVFDENKHLLSGYKSPLEGGKHWYEMEVSPRNYANYYPAYDLPQDSVLVVRTEKLREFDQLIADNEQERNTTTCSPPNKSDLSETERNTMLKLIQGMAIDAYGYDPESTRNSATGDKNGISTKLRTRGINIDADTIRKYLNAAKE